MKKFFTCIKLVLVGLFIIMFVGNNRVLATSQMTVNSLVKSPVNETVDLTVNYHIDGEGDGIYEYMYTERKENAYGTVVNVQQLRMNHKFHSSVDFVDMKLDGLYGVLDSIEVTENHTIDLYYEGDYERLPETVE